MQNMPTPDVEAPLRKLSQVDPDQRGLTWIKEYDKKLIDLIIDELGFCLSIHECFS